MNLDELTEAFRKALVDTFIPEIRQLREDMRKQNAELRGEIRQLREDMQKQNAELRGEIRQLREDMQRQNAQLREDMRTQNAELREDMKEIRGALNVVLHRLDVVDRVGRLEGQVEYLLKKAS